MAKLSINRLGTAQIVACIISGDQKPPGLKNSDDLLKQALLDDFKFRCVKKATRHRKSRREWRGH